MRSKQKTHKPVVWIESEIKTPPFSARARREAGFLVGEVQRGHLIPFPQSRPMTEIGRGCHELRVRDEDFSWRIFYYIGSSEIAILDIVKKKSQKTPKRVIERCRRRLKDYLAEEANGGHEK